MSPAHGHVRARTGHAVRRKCGAAARRKKSCPDPPLSVDCEAVRVSARRTISRGAGKNRAVFPGVFRLAVSRHRQFRPRHFTGCEVARRLPRGIVRCMAWADARQIDRLRDQAEGLHAARIANSTLFRATVPEVRSSARWTSNRWSLRRAWSYKARRKPRWVAGRFCTRPGTSRSFRSICPRPTCSFPAIYRTPANRYPTAVSVTICSGCAGSRSSF